MTAKLYWKNNEKNLCLIYNSFIVGSMLTKFHRFCAHHNLLTAGDKVLVAVSGGLDSMVLFDLMLKSNIQFGITHCNFYLRGPESDDEEKFVKNTAKEHNIECFAKGFETSKYAGEHKISIQQAARGLRYDWFEELIRSYGYTKLATAHHASDQSETILYNLTKGCGISGLRGIPIKNQHIIRPLLFATREEIFNYAERHNIQWREDSSNTDEKYSRNMIRHTVIPKLKQINPSIDKTMLRNATRYRSIEQLVLSKVEDIKSRYLISENEVDILSSNWVENEEGSIVLLEEILKVYGFNYDQIIGVYYSLGQQPGKAYFSTKYKLNVDRGKIYISNIVEDEGFELEIDEKKGQFNIANVDFEMQKANIGEFQLNKNKNFACLDFDKLVFPLKMRSWRQGDDFIPLGMKNRKKLSDFMIDQKIPVNLKERVILLESNGEIAWVAGHRIDDRFKVSSRTNKVLIIEKK